MNPVASQTLSPPPSMEEFCIKVPLYEQFELVRFGHVGIYAIYCGDYTFDSFCVGCGQTSVFRSPTSNPRESNDIFQYHLPRVIIRHFHCSRLASHQQHFIFKVHDSVIEKIGQLPSLADLSNVEIRKYKSVVDEDHFRELSKAIGLAAHGIGIGSFIYLRRIFERLIEEARSKAAGEANWDEGKFKASRMAEKIDLLKAYLPDYLVEHRKIYGILSSGIHSLDEQTCLQAFQVVKTGIELILEQKLSEKIRSDKMKSTGAQLLALQQRLSAIGDSQADGGGQ